MIKLLLNADDFGYSKVFNEEILKLLGQGYIKSTSVMIREVGSDQKDQIAELIRLREVKRVSVGLHFWLNEGGNFEKQLKEQHAKFVKTFGFEPSHFDVHMPKVKLVEPVLRAVTDYAVSLKMPVRHHLKADTKQTIYPFLYASDKSFEQIKEFLDQTKDGGSYEILFHPGRYDPDSRSTLNKGRERDTANILEVSDYLKQHKNIKLISYFEL